MLALAAFVVVLLVLANIVLHVFTDRVITFYIRPGWLLHGSWAAYSVHWLSLTSPHEANTKLAFKRKEGYIMLLWILWEITKLDSTALSSLVKIVFAFAALLERFPVSIPALHRYSFAVNPLYIECSVLTKHVQKVFIWIQEYNNLTDATQEWTLLWKQQVSEGWSSQGHVCQLPQNRKIHKIILWWGVYHSVCWYALRKIKDLWMCPSPSESQKID